MAEARLNIMRQVPRIYSACCARGQDCESLTLMEMVLIALKNSRRLLTVANDGIMWLTFDTTFVEFLVRLLMVSTILRTESVMKFSMGRGLEGVHFGNRYMLK